MRCRRVGMIPARVDLDAQAASLQQKIEPRLAEARAGQRTVPFVDAAHFVLLRVIERLDLSIHNNRNETDQRDVAKKRQISAGTRSADGRRCRDTFASPKKTCRKQGVSFWAYLKNRVAG